MSNMLCKIAGCKVPNFLVIWLYLPTVHVSRPTLYILVKTFPKINLYIYLFVIYLQPSDNRYNCLMLRNVIFISKYFVALSVDNCYNYQLV